MKTKIFLDFIPVLLFFVAFKIYGIYVATGIAMTASIIQLAVFWMKHGYLETMHIITFVLIFLLGGATLLFHNDIFIKWKPTAINWSLALFFFCYGLITKKPFVQKMMEKEVTLPPAMWARLNLTWVIFFGLIGLANIVVAYHFDTNTWVNFKLFGVLGLTALFVIAQAVYLTRHIQADATQDSKNQQTSI